MATVEQVTALLGVIAAAHPDRFEITDDRIDVYADLLADLDIITLKAATRQHLATSPHPPTVADLRRLCAQVSVPALPDWGEAWRELLDQIGRVGSYGMPSWSSPVVAEAVRQFGPWRELCQMEVDQTPTNRAQFRQVYEAVTGRAQRTAALLPDVRAFAQATGALPEVTSCELRVTSEDAHTPPALPSPLVTNHSPLVYANFRRYREEQRTEREAAGRAAVARWQAEQGGQDAV